ncbi:MAG TPA: hypothetical protein VKE41_05290, partial [Roseiflexaceae bacterium]|nr:hypothetical protein [Roseiflexaceae bacterium]
LMEQQPGFVDAAMSNLVVCRFFASRAADMHAELSSSLAQLESGHAQYGSPATAAALSEGRGLVALREQDALRAVDYLHYAAAQWQALGHPYDQLRALVALGRALRQVGAVGEARAALDQALSLVEALAAQLDAAELKAAFLNSPLLQELHRAIAALSATA